MSACVVDASVLVAAVADSGVEGRWAAKLVRFTDLAAPHLAAFESTNILRRLALAGKMQPAEIEQARVDLWDIGLLLYPFAPLGRRVWELRANLTSYDAAYVALAEALDLPLATLDRALTRATGPRCGFLLPE